jgi:hypothetical protein
LSTMPSLILRNTEVCLLNFFWDLWELYTVLCCNSLPCQLRKLCWEIIDMFSDSSTPPKLKLYCHAIEPKADLPQILAEVAALVHLWMDPRGDFTARNIFRNMLKQYKAMWKGIIRTKHGREVSHQSQCLTEHSDIWLDTLTPIYSSQSKCIHFRAKAKWDEAQPCWEKGCEQTDKTPQPEIYSLLGHRSNNNVWVYNPMPVASRFPGIWGAELWNLRGSWIGIPEKIAPPAPTSRVLLCSLQWVLLKQALHTSNAWWVKFSMHFLAAVHWSHGSSHFNSTYSDALRRRRSLTRH